MVNPALTPPRQAVKAAINWRLDSGAAILPLKGAPDGPAQALRRIDAGALPGLDPKSLLASRPAAILLARCAGGLDAQRLGALLAVAEALCGLDDGSVGIVAEIGTGAGLLALGSFAGATPRLRAIGWNAADLAADIGAPSARTAEAALIGPLRTARSLMLAAAAAARVPAIDSGFEVTDASAFRGDAAEARAEGFAAKVALDARQTAMLADGF